MWADRLERPPLRDQIDAALANPDGTTFAEVERLIQESLRHGLGMRTDELYALRGRLERGWLDRLCGR